MKKYIVITTINGVTPAISAFSKMHDWQLVIVGDRKSTPIEDTHNITFLSVDQQHELSLDIVSHLPFDHYTRKNIGYLYAIQKGAEVIYETDDDNIPHSYWALKKFECTKVVQSDSTFANIYRYFSDELVWPRGYPLEMIHGQSSPRIGTSTPVKIGVWQGLADSDPDVDAIYRLIFNRPITFDRKEAVALPEGTYCPFNSQNTSWSKHAFPFLYLPATTSFRFTDILRGYVAQRLLWVSGMHLGFHEATVYQERNAHDFMRDFADEVECFLNTRRVVEVLHEMDFDGDPQEDLLRAYYALRSADLVRSHEISTLEAWVRDLESTL